MHGGATVWHTPAVDPELGLVYFSTGNPGPDFNGAVRAGDNLFSASIVALEARTGKYRWHFQEVHHDIWDYDAPNPVVLFDAVIDGRARKGLAQVGKTGWAYILDRETGEPLIGIEERPVPQEPRQATAATQPYPAGDAIVPQHVEIAPEGYHLVNDGRIFTPYIGDKGMIVSPSLYGGANWPPSSYDPMRQLLFVCALRCRRQLHRRRPRFRDSARRATLRRRRRRLRAAAAHGHLRGRRRHDEHARVAVSLARPVLQRLVGHGRRPRVRRPQRRPADGARLGYGTASSGSSRPAPA